jgi:hypothetical protein
MTAARARPSAPTASGTVICDASSNTTRSKSIEPGGMNRASESGLTRTQGVSSPMTSPKVWTSLRTDRPPRVRPTSRSRAATVPKLAPGRKGRPCTTRSGMTPRRVPRSACDAPTNRSTTRSRDSLSNEVSAPVANLSCRAASDRPRSRAPAASAAGMAPESIAQRAMGRPCSSNGASVWTASTHRRRVAAVARSASRA